MALKRVDHWDTRAFHEFLLGREKMPFVWGYNDCCLLAADAIKAITGTDIADDFRGHYTDQRSAFLHIKAVTGGNTVAHAAEHSAKKHGLTENTHPLKAKRGDLVTIANGGDLIAGVVHLNGKHVISISESGLVRLPITSITRSWSY